MLPPCPQAGASRWTAALPLALNALGGEALTCMSDFTKKNHLKSKEFLDSESKALNKAHGSLSAWGSALLGRSRAREAVWASR